MTVAEFRVLDAARNVHSSPATAEQIGTAGVVYMTSVEVAPKLRTLALRGLVKRHAPVSPKAAGRWSLTIKGARIVGA